ncbi:hypothetical protein D3C86_2133390 [compost metagenome]
MKFTSVRAGVPPDPASVIAPDVRLKVAAFAFCPVTAIVAEFIGANIPRVLISMAIRA